MAKTVAKSKSKGSKFNWSLPKLYWTGVGLMLLSSIAQKFDQEIVSYVLVFVGFVFWILAVRKYFKKD